MLECSKAAGVTSPLVVRLHSLRVDSCRLEVSRGHGESLLSVASEEVLCARFAIDRALTRLARRVSDQLLAVDGQHATWIADRDEADVHLARSLLSEGRWSDAREFLQKVWDPRQANPLLGLSLAELQERCHDFAGAIETRRQLLALAGDDPPFRSSQGDKIAFLENASGSRLLNRLAPGQGSLPGWIRVNLPLADRSAKVAVGPDGSIWLAGQGALMSASSGCVEFSPNLVFHGGSQALLMKLTPAGEIAWLVGATGTSPPNTNLSHAESSALAAIAALPDGAALGAGLFTGEMILAPGAPFARKVTCHGAVCGFVARFSGEGEVSWLQGFDCPEGWEPISIALAEGGEALVLGELRPGRSSLDPWGARRRATGHEPGPRFHLVRLGPSGPARWRAAESCAPALDPEWKITEARVAKRTARDLEVEIVLGRFANSRTPLPGRQLALLVQRGRGPLQCLGGSPRQLEELERRERDEASRFPEVAALRAAPRNFLLTGMDHGIHRRSAWVLSSSEWWGLHPVGEGPLKHLGKIPKGVFVLVLDESTGEPGSGGRE